MNIITDFKEINGNISPNSLILGDCLDIMPKIENKSIDLIFCDLPYGTTNCSWDKEIPLNYNIDGMYYEEYLKKSYKEGISYIEANDYWIKNRKDGLWQQYERIIKDDGAILLFAQSPFDKLLGESNKKLFRYEWIWEKTQATGGMNSKKMPMKAHENILVFYKKCPTYNPIMTEGHIRKVSKAKNRAACIIRRNDTDNIYNNEYPDKVKDYDSTIRFPRSVLKFKSDKQTSNLHKTQKPLALVEYMVKTYSNENDVVLDNCFGSNTTGVACKNLNRRYIGIEKDEKSFNIGVNRLCNNHI